MRFKVAVHGLDASQEIIGKVSSKKNREFSEITFKPLPYLMKDRKFIIFQKFSAHLKLENFFNLCEIKIYRNHNFFLTSWLLNKHGIVTQF